MSCIYQMAWYFNTTSYKNRPTRREFVRRFVRRPFIVLPPILLISSDFYGPVVVGTLFTGAIIIYSIFRCYRYLFGWKKLVSLENPASMQYKQLLGHIRRVPLLGMKAYITCIVGCSLLNMGIYKMAPSTAFDNRARSSSDFVDFLYFTTVTMATVGYGDVTPLSPLARIVVTGEVLVSVFFLVMFLGILIGIYNDLVQTLQGRQ